MEVDPDFRLFTRLALGRGWRPAATLGAWGTAAVFLGSGWLVLPFALSPGGGPSANLFAIAVAAIVFGPLRALARLIDLEQSGLLNQSRLCGRSAGRMLAASIAGYTWPFAGMGLALALVFVAIFGNADSILYLALVFVAVLDAMLIAFALLPVALVGDPRFLTPLLMLVILATSMLVTAVAIGRPAFYAESRMLLVAAAIIVTPAAVWLAARRFRRPMQWVWSARIRPAFLLARLLPRGGPPEFVRQTRIIVSSGGTLVAILAAPLTVAIVAVFVRPTSGPRTALRELGMNGAVPFFLTAAAMFVMWSTIRGESESHTRDLVDLTSQRAGAIVTSWYVAVALPFWLAAALAAATAEVLDPAIAEWSWTAAALMASLPAIALAEAVQRRRFGTSLALAFALTIACTAYAQAQDWGVYFHVAREIDRAYPLEMFQSGSRPGDRAERSLEYSAYAIATSRLRQEAERRLPGHALRGRPAKVPWRIPIAIFAITTAALLALVTASNRVRRAAGPSLTGAAAVAGIAAIGLVARTWPIIAFPRLLPALLVAVAPLAAEERARPTPPWRRLAVCGLAALGVGFVLARQGGLDSAWSAATGAASALAIGAGLLVHETLVERPLASIACRAGIFALMTRMAWEPGSWPHGIDLAELPVLVARVPPAPQLFDLAALAAIAACAAMLHARRRHAPAAALQAGR